MNMYIADIDWSFISTDIPIIKLNVTQCEHQSCPMQSVSQISGGNDTNSRRI